MSVPKNFNINQKFNFTQQNKSILKKNTKDSILEERWLMK